MDARTRRNLRWFVMTLLVVQNASAALLTRWTRVKRVGVPMFLDSAAVLFTELLKVPMCLLMMLVTIGPRRSGEEVKAAFKDLRDLCRLAVPALCYSLQNWLFFVALSHLNASTYQVLSQTKALATAGFWVTILGGTLRLEQWVGLGLLVAGVSAVQLDAAGGAATAAHGNQLVGVVAVLASSLLSGFANVYFEKLVKTTPASIWVRNIQLAVFTVPQGLALSLKDRATIATSGIFTGFDGAVWGVVALKAIGGLVVASTVKYADSVLKTFATAISIVVTCLFSVRPMLPPSVRTAEEERLASRQERPRSLPFRRYACTT